MLDGRSRRALISLIVPTLVACAGEGPGVGTPVVRDSTGIRIVEHGALDSLVAFSVGEPLYRLGDETDEYQFIDIADGALGADGQVVVGDRGSDEVLVVRRDAEVLWTAGGTGEGPGEFSSLSAVGWAADTVLAHDTGLRRVTYLAGGETLTTKMLPDPMSFVQGQWLEGGRMITSPGGYRPITTDAWVSMALVGHKLGSSVVDTLLVYDYAQGIPDMDQLADPFRAFGAIGVRGSRIAYGRGDRAEIRVLDADGSLTQIWRWAHPRADVTPELWDGYANRRRANPGSRSAAEIREMLAELEAAVQGELPAFSAFYVDAVGRVWVRAYDPTRSLPTSFQVFGPDGEWLGYVALPERTEILDIGSDLLLASSRDEFDVQSLVLFPLEPAEG